MGFKDLFWVDEGGNEDTNSVVVADYVAVPQPNNQQVQLPLTEAHAKLLPDELVFFESQLKLFEKTTSVASQLLSIVMVTVTQKFPNTTHHDMIAMYEANKHILAQLQREHVASSDGVIDNKSSAVRDELNVVGTDIATCTETLHTLQDRETKLKTKSANFTKQKQSFADKISKEHAGLLRHVDAHIKILTNHSEET